MKKLLFGLLLIGVCLMGCKSRIKMEQDATTNSYLNDDHTVSTYIWLTRPISSNKKSTIEWSDHAWHVKACDIDSVKAAQKKKATPILAQIKKNFKDFKNQDCD